MKYNIFNRKPKVEILKSINVSDIEWCDEAVLVRIENGKGTLTHRISDEDEDYMFFSQLLLNDKPIIQGKYPICPTCAGMLATGYGIDNTNSEELIKVRDCMNSEYRGIMNATESIKPLLGLLKDEETVIKLDYLLKYLSESCKEEAYIIAKIILDEEDEYLLRLPQKSAIKELLHHRNEESEQYMIKYLVEHDSKDECWNLVNSYWD